MLGGTDIDNAVAAKQAIALVDEPCHASVSYRGNEGRRLVGDTQRKSLDEFVGRKKASDGGARRENKLGFPYIQYWF